MKLIFFSGLLVFCVWTLVATEAPKSASAPSSGSPRAQVTVENWDKGGALSHWVYTHVSEVFPSAVIRRGGAILDLPVQIRPEIGAVSQKEIGVTSRAKRRSRGCVSRILSPTKINDDFQ